MQASALASSPLVLYSLPSVNLLTEFSSSVMLTLSACSTVIAVLSELVISASASTMCTSSFLPASTSTLPLVSFPERIYVPAFEMVSTPSFHAAPSPLTLADVPSRVILQADDSSYPTSRSEASIFISISEATIEEASCEEPSALLLFEQEAKLVIANISAAVKAITFFLIFSIFRFNGSSFLSFG